MKYHLLPLALALAGALVLAGCSSSSDGQTPDTDDDRTPQQLCEADGGTWANDMCTTAEMKQQQQRMAISGAASMAQAAVLGVNDDSTDSEVNAADAAIKAVKDAVAAATDLAEDDEAIVRAQAVLAAIEPVLAAAKTSRTATMAAKATAQMKADAKLGKDLHAALGGNATANTTALDNATISFTDTAAQNLQVTAAVGAGAIPDEDTPPVATLKPGESAGALGSWNGTHYSHTDAGTKVVNAAVVYTNKGPGKTVQFSERNTIHTGDSEGTAPTYTAIKGYVNVATGGTITNAARIRAPAFTHSGTQSHDLDADTGIFTTRGTLDGAAGVYRCTGTCSTTNDNDGAPSAMTGTWHFKPDAGAAAMAHEPDGSYLYFGWWLSKDKDGKPTAADAFTGVIGTGIEGTQPTLPLTNNPTTLGGSATYAGKAAGKFAMSNPLDSTGSGGHFTADATLTAKFAANAGGGGVSGTIDNFMANGESVPWSVALHRTDWNGTIFGQFATPTADAGEGTTWSIDGNEAPKSGTWSGQMYDEAATGDLDDGSNVPTSTTGTFYSEFATIGRMVGAFGADKQE